ncbi:helix-turn-helix domain protein [Segniliparus rotundus DSM 44985]|uniref:Helix-turn-helix domain protein n=1 Tax=Segniliparus rotundus (strain ATCC BAA-972 / CDC 1076 / CIP 108378 / DSM 44985 / JCM 13578) TaxID=640132 RepID=D6ZAH1_SEGRD|nr:helix-turn-helix transcriptional regulator [Segniliparus rotundus]ADG96713.1 helix-turn-helix domain protein [Segniliparus rotundus DSM 44985]
MGELNETVSRTVQGHLDRLGLSRSDAAQALGVSQQTLADLLGNHRVWRLDEVDSIAEWLEVSPKDLFFPGRGDSV